MSLRAPLVCIAMACLAATLLPASESRAQSMPTTGALINVFKVERNNAEATIFTIDVDGREYWITARHVLSGVTSGPPYGALPKDKVTLQIMGRDGKWGQYTFSVVNADDDPNVDIAVLAPPTPMANGDAPKPISDGPMLGGDCQFLGFPYGRFFTVAFKGGTPIVFPYVKHCVVSAVVSDPVRQMFLDGINNKGFSGGPVIYHTGPQQVIIGVISGYLPDRLNIEKVNGVSDPDMSVQANSGFIVAFPIALVVEAIRRNPIGPSRVQK